MSISHCFFDNLISESDPFVDSRQACELKSVLASRQHDLSEDMRLLFTSGQAVYNKLIADKNTCNRFKARIAKSCTAILNDPYSKNNIDQLDNLLRENNSKIRNDMLFAALLIFIAAATIAASIAIAILVPPLIILPPITALILTIFKLSAITIGSLAVAGFGCNIIKNTYQLFSLNNGLNEVSKNKIVNEARNNASISMV